MFLTLKRNQFISLKLYKKPNSPISDSNISFVSVSEWVFAFLCELWKIKSSHSSQTLVSPC